jgi:hypothetical protein
MKIEREYDMVPNKILLVLVGILCIVSIMMPAVQADANGLNPDASNKMTSSLEFKDCTFPIFLQETRESLLKTEQNPKQDFQKIPLAVKQFDLVSFNQPFLNEQLKSGSDLIIQIRGKDYQAHLSRMEFDHIDDGIDSYEGNLVGIKNSNVVLTVSDKVTIGSVTLNNETFYIDPVTSREHAEMGGSPVHIIYSSKDVEAREIQIDDGPATLPHESAWTNNQKLASSLQGVSPDQFVTVKILVATDKKFFDSSDDWVAVAQDIIAVANQQFGRDDIKVILDPIYDSSKTNQLSEHPAIISDPIGSFKEIYPEADLAAHSADLGLYLGGFNADGPNQGSGYGFGGKYAWSQMVLDDPGYLATTHGRRCVTVHELGHLFGAKHDYSGGFEQAYLFTDLYGLHHTVMWHSFVEFLNVYEFSSNNYHGDILHDNARRIRETRNTVAHYAEGDVPFYTITPISGPNGRIFPAVIPGEDNPPKIIAGDSFSFTISTDTGYVIDKVLVNTHPVNDAEGWETYILTVSNILHDTTLDATFKPKPHQYLLTPVAGNNGKISPEQPVVVQAGGSQTFTITPGSGFIIADVRVDGKSVGAKNSYTFSNVQHDSTITATFTRGHTYTITPSAGPHGTISPSKPVTVPSGGSQTFTMTPDAGYAVADVLVDGKSVGAVSSYTFSNVNRISRITVTFKRQITYTITPSAGPHGTISPSKPVTVPSGGSQTFTITSDPGYVIADVLVDGKSVGAVNSYTFTNVKKNCAIRATLKQEVTYTITPSAGPHGSISPSTPVRVVSGGSQDFYMSPEGRYNPEGGYIVEDVLVDGKSVGPYYAWIFENVQADHTISVTFKQWFPNEWVWSRDGWDGWRHTTLNGDCSSDDCPEYGPVMVNGHGEHGVNVLSGEPTSITSIVGREFSVPWGYEWNTVTFIGQFSPINKDDDPEHRHIAIFVNGGLPHIFYPPENGKPFDMTVTFPPTKYKVVLDIWQDVDNPVSSRNYYLEFHSLKFTMNNSIQIPEEVQFPINSKENLRFADGIIQNATKNF